MMTEVHIWLGTFASSDRFSQFMKEDYDEDAPINEFCASQNESFYDHDWIESFHNPRRTAKSLLGDVSYSSQFKHAAAEVAAGLNLTKPNAVIVIDSGEISKPVSAKGEGYELAYIGKFPGHTESLLPESVEKTTLNLSRQSLISIPDYVFEQTQLESLHLSDNQLTDLPEALFRLENLEFLSISGNKIKTLPGHFGRLKKLERLQAGDNEIEEIHEDFCRAPSLHSINLTANNLKSIPNNIGQLSLAEVLILKDNELEALPDSIVELKHLRQLTLTGNNFNGVPENIGSLQEIRFFSI